MGRYTADSDDNTKSMPKSIPVKSFGRAIVPAVETVAERASHVIINASGSYHFLYETSCSEGSVSHNTGAGSGAGETYEQAITIKDDGAAIRLDINPVAWSGSRFKSAPVEAGDVTFVYRGGA
jgi:hypothetical protein|tara:strand:+ start:3922 stop:4290 length:369 start_codon:yes stop_codon:yes gene_type:complete